MDITLLLSLTDRVTGLAAPAGMHPDAWRLYAPVDGWARGRGLVLGDPDASPIGRTRCERLAARVFPAADLAAVDLFARWLTWTFALDDTLDQAPLADSGSAVHGLYDDLLRSMRRGHARPGARALEAALVELWQATAAGRGRDWRRRFMLHMEDHRDGCAGEAVNRRVGHTPAPAEYTPLRRKSCAPFLYDLVEPVLGVELPGRLLITPAWKAMAEGTVDVVAWSNDIASFRLESARGDTHNLPAVLARAYGIDTAEASERVLDAIAARVADAREAARALAEMLDRLRLTPAQREAAAKVVRVYLDTPRAHLEWLAESERYEQDAEPAGAPPDGHLGLGAFASLSRTR